MTGKERSLDLRFLCFLLFKSGQFVVDDDSCHAS